MVEWLIWQSTELQSNQYVGRVLTRILCNDAPFWFGKNLTFSRIQTPQTPWSDARNANCSATLWCYFVQTTYINIWACSCTNGTYNICEQRRLKRACASAQSRQSLRCSLTQHRELEDASDKEPETWPYWTAVQVHLKDCLEHNLKVSLLLRWLINEPHHAKMCLRRFWPR